MCEVEGKEGAGAVGWLREEGREEEELLSLPPPPHEHVPLPLPTPLCSPSELLLLVPPTPPHPPCFRWAEEYVDHPSSSSSAQTPS